MNIKENSLQNNRGKEMVKKNGTYDVCPIIMINAPGEILIANSLIKKFKKKNDIDFDLSICLDYMIEEYGVYCPVEFPNYIIINPDLAIGINDKESHLKLSSYYGYINDYSLIANTLHEFSHFLCYQVYTTIIDDYEKEFPIDRLYLCDYSNENITEEIAEIIRLYILNPLLLKLIDKPVYDFVRRYFKSPSPVSHKHTLGIIDDFPIDIKTELIDKWKIVHDYGTKKLVKVEDHGKRNKKCS